MNEFVNNEMKDSIYDSSKDEHTPEDNFYYKLHSDIGNWDELNIKEKKKALYIRDSELSKLHEEASKIDNFLYKDSYKDPIGDKYHQELEKEEDIFVGHDTP